MIMIIMFVVTLLLGVPIAYVLGLVGAAADYHGTELFSGGGAEIVFLRQFL